MTPLTGRESSILALLAQRPDTPSAIFSLLSEQLGPVAREIANVLTGRTAASTEESRRAAEGLLTWAKRLRDGRMNREP